MRGSSFKVFESVLDARGVIRALNAGTHGAALSRSELDGLNEVVRRYGAKAVAPMPVGEGGAWGSNLAKFFSDEQAAAVNAVLRRPRGRPAAVRRRPPRRSPAALGALRLHLGAHFALVAARPPRRRCGWSTSRCSSTTRRTSATRRCTTRSPRRRCRGDPHAPLSFEDPGALRSRAYDLVVDGWELGGGSIRIHDRRGPAARCSPRSASAPEEAQARFGFLLDALRYGAPPHGGIAMGIDRIVAIMRGEESIREVIAFPKTASGADPLTGAPAPVDDAQLRELGLRALPRAPGQA